VEVAQGCFFLDVAPKSTGANRPAPGFLSGDNSGPVIWWPGIALSPQFYLQIPLWMPLLLIGSVTAWLWRLDRPPPPPDHCQKCGYDLTGNVSGICPECGTPTEAGKPRSGGCE